MRAYLTPVGLAHSLLGLLTTGVGVLPVALALWLGFNAVRRYLADLLFLLTEPGYLTYMLQNAVFDLVLIGLIAGSGLMLIGLGLFELFAGVGLVLRWRSARWAGFVAALPNLVLGLPGIALAVGTVVVLMDAEVQQELGGAR